MVKRKMIRFALVAQLALASMGMNLFAGNNDLKPVTRAQALLNLADAQKKELVQLQKQNKTLQAKNARLVKANEKVKSQAKKKGVTFVEVEKPVTKVVEKVVQVPVEKVVEVPTGSSQDTLRSNIADARLKMAQKSKNNALRKMDEQVTQDILELNAACDGLQEDNTKLASKANDAISLADSRKKAGIAAAGAAGVAGVAVGAGALKAAQSETGQKVLAKGAQVAKTAVNSLTKENAKAAISFIGNKLSGAKDAVVNVCTKENAKAAMDSVTSAVKKGYNACTKENAQAAVNSGVEVVKNNPKTSLAVAAGGLALAGYAAKKLYNKRQEAKELQAKKDMAKNAAGECASAVASKIDAAHKEMCAQANASAYNINQLSKEIVNISAEKEKAKFLADECAKAVATKNARQANKDMMNMEFYNNQVKPYAQEEAPKKKGMSTLAKVGLGVAGTAVTAGALYGAYKGYENREALAELAGQVLASGVDKTKGFCAQASDHFGTFTNEAPVVDEAPVAPVVEETPVANETSFTTDNFDLAPDNDFFSDF